MFEGSGAEEEGSGLEEGGEDDEEEGPMYFFLEESTGYMEPALAFLSIVHTIISFLCIIGYNCLKVCSRPPDRLLLVFLSVSYSSSSVSAAPGSSGYLQEREGAGQKAGV